MLKSFENMPILKQHLKQKKVLFTIGPVQMDRKISQLGNIKLPYFRTDEFSKINKEVVGILKEITYTNRHSEVVLLTSSGTGAMEAAVMNTFTERDKLLIVNGGTFGQRFVDICNIHNIPYEEIKLKMGKILKPNQLKPYSGKGFTGFLTNACETSTGVLYDLQTIGKFCKKEKLILVVDAISSFLADPYFMDAWNIDITIISSQKGLALPPGLSFLVINRKTLQKIESVPVRSLYFNVKDYIFNMKRGQTPFTPAIGIILQLHARLRQIKKRRVENIVNSTAYIAKMFREKIADLPFYIPSENLSNALTPLCPQNNVDADKICEHLKNKYNIYVNSNSGVLKQRLFRVGHIGNLTINDNKFLIKAFDNMKEEGLL